MKICAAAPLLRFLILVLQCREHDTCLFARHALARTEAAVGALGAVLFALAWRKVQDEEV